MWSCTGLQQHPLFLQQNSVVFFSLPLYCSSGRVPTAAAALILQWRGLERRAVSPQPGHITPRLELHAPQTSLPASPGTTLTPHLPHQDVLKQNSWHSGPAACVWIQCLTVQSNIGWINFTLLRHTSDFNLDTAIPVLYIH